MMRGSLPLAAFVFLALVGFLMAGVFPLGVGQEPNVGLLRLADLKHPRQVAPSARISFVIDAEYAIRFNATVRSSLFEGSQGNLGPELWRSDPVLLTGGGDMLWSANLTAPASEQEWTLTAYAYYLEGGQWKYYNDTDQGPGFEQTQVKVAALATLEIDLGVPDATVSVDSSTDKTTALGNVRMQLPVGTEHQVAIEPILLLQNSTRLIFARWQDGSNTTQRTITLDGDTTLAAVYKTQYLLTVNSIVPAYAHSAWYDPGTNVTLRANATVPASGVLGAMGIHYVFNGWSGDIDSSALTVNLTANRPKVVNANFTANYTSIIIPSILLAGVVAGIIVAALRRRKRAEPAPVPLEEESEGQATEAKFCNNCGEQVEETWTHCIHCGSALGSSEPVQS